MNGAEWAAARERDLASMTVRESAATLMPLAAAPIMLERARRDFPGYGLAIEERDGGAVIASQGMAVPRWYRL